MDDPDEETRLPALGESGGDMTDEFILCVYASDKGECHKGCRVTYCLPVSSAENLYGQITFRRKDDIRKAIDTADVEQKAYRTAYNILKQIVSGGEVINNSVSAQMILQDIFSACLSKDFPSFSPIVPFSLIWYAQSKDGSRRPVSVDVSF